jgi:hypothetical protein
VALGHRPLYLSPAMSAALPSFATFGMFDSEALSNMFDLHSLFSYVRSAFSVSYLVICLIHRSRHLSLAENRPLLEICSIIGSPLKYVPPKRLSGPAPEAPAPPTSPVSLWRQYLSHWPRGVNHEYHSFWRRRLGSAVADTLLKKI